MIVIRLCLVFAFCFFSLGISAQNPDVAKEYMKQGDFEKAEDEFEKLIRKKELVDLVYGDYIQLLIKTRKFEKAQKIIQAQIKVNPNRIGFYLDLENVQMLSMDMEGAKLTKQKYIELAGQNDQFIYEIQNRYYTEGKFKELVEFLLDVQSRQNIPHKFGIQLARAYLFNGEKNKMLLELLKWGDTHGNVDYVRSSISDNFKTDEERKIVEKTLFQFIQDKPNDVFYNETLIWFYTQQKEFARAFRFSKALDKRLKLNGQNVLDLGMLAFNNQVYDEAQAIFSYLTVEYAQTPLFPISTYWLIQSKEKIIKNTFPVKREEVIALKNEYESLRKSLRDHTVQIDVTRNLALLEAFYLDNKEKAIQLLLELLANPQLNPQLESQCKLDLADIYVLNDEPWESSLLYMQVEKAQKENSLGELAKLKNAQLYYYQSEFDLAKEILDILKKATTREISNDAIKLGLHILENRGEDSVSYTLISYSKAELLIFQNKLKEADFILDSLYTTAKDSPIADDVLWLRSEIALKQGKYEEANAFLQTIYTDFSFDTLADDALFQSAEIEEKYIQNSDKALLLYEKILFQFPGSILAVDARKRIRQLRGDKLE